MALCTSRKILKTSHYLRTMSTTRIKTAGILVIGDELLKGEVVDTNSPHITKELHKIGIKVKKICVIGDEVDEISDEVKTFSKSYNYVITTGGIGPTHDDVTFEAVGKAFDDTLVLNNQLRTICERFYKTTDVNHPGMKLAKIPQSAKLLFSDGGNYPNVSVQNVYMFPGIPELFLKSFNGLCKKLFKSDDITFYTKVVYVNLTEDKIADVLTQLVSDFSDVQFGSYPKLFHDLYKVKITIESINEKSAQMAFETLLTKFPKEVIVGTD